MAQYTVRVDDELEREIEEYMDESDASQSADLRELLRLGLDAPAMQNRIDELRGQLAAANKKNTKIGELAEYHEEEQSLQRIQNERERLKSESGALTRFWWWATGMPSVEDEADE